MVDLSRLWQCVYVTIGYSAMAYKRKGTGYTIERRFAVKSGQLHAKLISSISTPSSDYFQKLSLLFWSSLHWLQYGYNTFQQLALGTDMCCQSDDTQSLFCSGLQSQHFATSYNITGLYSQRRTSGPWINSVTRAGKQE